VNDRQLIRYSRQILLTNIDIDGQERLLKAKVLVMGLGGLGSPAALYLAAAGVGHLILADFDDVDLSNLQRQIIHQENTVGLNKAKSAEKRLQALNSECLIETCLQKLEKTALAKIVRRVDLVLDCTDNFSTRFMLNKVCKEQQALLISGAAIGFQGQVSVFSGRSEDACYRCLYDEQGQDDETCSNNGVLAPVVGIIGSMQALEAIKYLTQTGECLINKLLLLDALTSQWRSLKLKQDPQCPICHP